MIFRYFTLTDDLFRPEEILAAAGEFVRGGATTLRFEPFGPRSAAGLPRLLRELHTRSPETVIEVLDTPWLDLHPKLREALRRTGMRNLITAEALLEGPTDSDLKRINVVTRYPDGRASSAEFRITRRCNESCSFCWAFRDGDDPTSDEIRQSIRDLARQGLSGISFSGGEPTLRENLPDLMAFARDLGVQMIGLQTNGLRLADRTLVDRLVESGLVNVFLSLHGHEPDLSDRITGVTGGWTRTRAALRHLLAHRLFVIVNHVITKENAPFLPDFARFCVEEATAAGSSLDLNFSLASPVGRNKTAYKEYLPRLKDVRPGFIEALRLLKGTPARLHNFTTFCAPPLCLAAPHRDLFEELNPLPSNPSHEFIKPSVCSRCGLTAYCNGVRDIYALTYGVDELIPFE